MAETDAHPMNFHTCIVRMRHGVYCLINKMGLTAERNVMVELPCWLTRLLSQNNRLVTAMQGCVGTIKGHTANDRLSERIAHGLTHLGV